MLHGPVSNRMKMRQDAEMAKEKNRKQFWANENIRGSDFKTSGSPSPRRATRRSHQAKKSRVFKIS